MRTLSGRKSFQILQSIEYKMTFWRDFDYSILKNVNARKKKDRSGDTYNDIIIMADTETSKKYHAAISDPYYDAIRNDVSHTSFIWKDSFKEIATKKEFAKSGIKFNSPGSHIDVYIEELSLLYPGIFVNAYNEIDCMRQLYDYLSQYETKEEDSANHIVAWSIALRCYQHNLVTLWGQDPDDFTECIKKLQNNLPGDETYIYFHNLPYDYCFLRKFLFKAFSHPKAQLNVRSLYPLTIRFMNGIILKDSLMLAQRSLEKWAKDLNVDHQKAVGSWDYDAIRNQSDDLTDEELIYIQNDVLAGVECIDSTMIALNCNISSIPLTATGIPRHEARAIGREFRAHDMFVRHSPEDYHLQLIFEMVFHGGYTHANRYEVGKVNPAKAKDFSSSYPYCALAFKYPGEKFWKLNEQIDVGYVMENMEEYAFICNIEIDNLDLKDLRFPMPPMASHKCYESYNEICDNGKVLRASKVKMWVTDVDLALYDEYYKGQFNILETYCSKKKYLPAWFTDYVYKCFLNKTKLKGVDAVQYAIEKAKLNAVAYGMIAQKPCKPEILENYESGEYYTQEMIDFDAMYQKHLKNRNSFLPYHWCMYVTAYAQYNLYQLGKCVSGIWLYSDTDSVYATDFDESKVQAYNDAAIQRLKDRGYHPIYHNNRYYYLGIAEDDGDYIEFKALHSKCYAKRDRETQKLSITVAGVPKKGAASLHNNIDEFKVGKLFPGSISGKLQHKYIYTDKIYIDEWGNKTGDSIDLSPCDYIIKPASIKIIEELEDEQINIQIYEEEAINEAKKSSIL